MGVRRKQQRPGNRETFDARMKLHLRQVELDGRVYRVLLLRPGAEARFSTNFYHQTWHLVSDIRGARLVARLLWGLAYQRLPGTLVALHGEFLRPTPFDADLSDPVLLLPGHLTGLDGPRFRALKERLARPGPTLTVRWLTFGLDRAADPEAGWEERDDLWRPEAEPLWRAEKMCRCGGWICYTAPPPVLRAQALSVYRMNAQRWGESGDYHFLVERRREHWLNGYPEGEVQIFADYRQRLSAAAGARRELLAEGGPPRDPQAFREAVWRRREEVRRRRAAARK
jgi:hypothetical protein